MIFLKWEKNLKTKLMQRGIEKGKINKKKNE